MKRNFVVGMFGGLIGSAMLLLVLSAAGIVGARSSEVAQSDVSRPNDVSAAAPLTSTFTYQGQLKTGSGSPISAMCDFQFGLWDSASGLAQIGITQTASSQVSNGLFTVGLNFGANDHVFDGNGRWLQIAVRCPAGSGSYTTLNPRQSLTPAPYAFALPGLYTQPNATSPNVIGGYNGNVISSTVVGGVIGGGGALGVENRVQVDYATVGGGANNTASGQYATIGGGASNTASNQYATVGGGYGNHASGSDATVGGGYGNTASGTESTVGGGYVNTASGPLATIPGGDHNVAVTYTLAAGHRAKANHPGAFVWADSTPADFASTGNDQFLIRANGGVGINSTGPFTAALSVNGQIVAGGIAVPSGSNEPFVATGANAGISMDDRAGGANPRWVVYPLSGSLEFFNSTSSNVVNINQSGKVTANGGFNGQCVSSGDWNTGTASSGNSCNMDVAEAFGTTQQTEPGDLVTLVTQDTSMPTVHKSTHSYEGLLIGVVSQNPGLVFDNGQTSLAGDNSKFITADKTVVALVGRVQVKVSMENGFIAIGDPLTSSSTPGVAMKATRAGKILGYAMGSANANGTVLALVQPGYYLPTDQLSTQTDSTLSFNWFNLLSVIAFAGCAFMWLQQRRSKQGQA